MSVKLWARNSLAIVAEWQQQRYIRRNMRLFVTALAPPPPGNELRNYELRTKVTLLPGAKICTKSTCYRHSNYWEAWPPPFAHPLTTPLVSVKLGARNSLVIVAEWQQQRYIRRNMRLFVTTLAPPPPGNELRNYVLRTKVTSPTAVTVKKTFRFKDVDDRFLEVQRAKLYHHSIFSTDHWIFWVKWVVIKVTQSD